MADWKDPLVEKLAERHPGAACGFNREVTAAAAMQWLSRAKSKTESDGADFLRDLIDAELRAGMDARKLLAQVQWEGDRYGASQCCPVCKVGTEYGDDYPTVVSQHEPGCRIRRLLGPIPEAP